jgi:hypothetical protein
VKIKKLNWVVGWVGVLVLIVVPAAFGDVQDVFSKFHPYISLQEEYNDNIYLIHNNPKGDFITTVSPGLKYITRGAGYNLDLDYTLGLNFYASESQNNYISHEGRLNAFYSFNPQWTVRLYDALTQSREGLEYYTVTTTTGAQSNVTSSGNGSLYLRQTFEPTLEYNFGREDQVALQYRNMIYRIVEGTGEDSTENSITTRLAYWFNIRNGINLYYTFTTAQFENTTTQFESQPDWVENIVSGRYNYRFNPRTMVFGAYSFSMIDFKDPGNDYTVNSPSVGVEYTFSSTLKGQAELGWFWQVMDRGESFNKPVYNLSITQEFQRTNYTLSLEGGYREQYFTADNLGFSWFNEVRANVTHRVRERMSVGLEGIIGRDEYQNPGRIDWNWGLRGKFSYQPLKWLTVSLEASTRTLDSDVSANSYLENRVFLKFTATY